MQKNFCDKCGCLISELPLEIIGFNVNIDSPLASFCVAVDYYHIELCEDCKRELRKNIEQAIFNYVSK